MKQLRGIEYPSSTDAAGQPLDPYVLTMTKDGAGRLAEIRGPSEPEEPAQGQPRASSVLLAGYSYLGGQVWERQHQNQLRLRFHDAANEPLYDGLGRVTGVRAVDGLDAGIVKTDFRYGYDRVGNRSFEQRRHEAMSAGLYRTRAFNADRLGKLTAWSERALPADPIAATEAAPADFGGTTVLDAERWSIDLLGNWGQHAIGPADPTPDVFQHNPLNQYSTVDPDGAGAGQAQKTLQYDWLGQLRKDNHAGKRFVWDGFGRLSRAYQLDSAEGESLIASYRYDAFNRRIEETVEPGFT